MPTIHMDLKKSPDRSYDIIIGSDLFEQIASELSTDAGEQISRYAVITDSNVELLYAEKLFDLLAEQNLRVDILSFAAGEPSKTRQTKADLEDRMLELGCGRDTCIVALGGGVTTDLAGFIAATYMRGIPYISIPTTILAAADASVGGKTGVDTSAGKNLIGTFYQPRRVYIDVSTWQTLPVEQVRNGLAETIKQAMIGDGKFFEYLESALESHPFKEDRALPRWLGPDVCLEIAKSNVEIKHKIVEQDEKENGVRAVLNFGHTIGHAIEALSDYELLHGFAVSIGMCIEAKLAVQLGYLSTGHAARLRSLLEKVGLPTAIPKGMNPRDIVEKTFLDKKARLGKARYVFPDQIGHMAEFEGKWTISVDESIVSKILSQYD